jgi:hypothetical protein
MYGPLDLAATYQVESSNKDIDLPWHYDPEPRSTVGDAPSPERVFSLDGTSVYSPGAIANHSPVSLIVLRAEIGEEVARRELDTAGDGAVIALYLDRRHILVNVAEG